MFQGLNRFLDLDPSWQLVNMQTEEICIRPPSRPHNSARPVWQTDSELPPLTDAGAMIWGSVLGPARRVVLLVGRDRRRIISRIGGRRRIRPARRAIIRQTIPGGRLLRRASIAGVARRTILKVNLSTQGPKKAGINIRILCSGSKAQDKGTPHTIHGF